MRKIFKSFVILLVNITLIAGFGSFSATAASPLVVKTQNGWIKGIKISNTYQYRGIPYAKPPVADLRWQSPQTPNSWSGIRDASKFGNVCYQKPGSAGGAKDFKESEDCLTLNVIKYLNKSNPDTTPKKMPVMVWIHGGGFGTGSGREKTFNNLNFGDNVILVNLNYRLGPLGFFAHPNLPKNVGTNFGLQDQIKALEWVKDNIANFGGDEYNITLFGESAGGVSVNTLMTSPKANRLFDKAISMSGFGREQPMKLPRARQAGVDLFNKLGIKDQSLKNLKTIPANSIIKETKNSILDGQVPILDGDTIVDTVANRFAQGKEAPVPYLVGTTNLEMPNQIVSLGAFGDKMTPGDVRKKIAGPYEAQIRNAYGNNWDYDKHFISDSTMLEPARNLAKLHSRKFPTFMYRFEIAPFPADILGGAVHATDVTYYFNDVKDYIVPNIYALYISPQEKLAGQINSYILNFARKSNPNGDNVPVNWNKFSPTGEQKNNIIRFTMNGPVCEVDKQANLLDQISTVFSNGRNAYQGVTFV